MNRYHSKADAYVVAERAKYGGPLPFNTRILVMAVAEHETNLGDAWNYSHNHGAIQLTWAQKKSVPPQFREDHGDSDPVQGKYVTAFWRFPDGIPCPYAGNLAGDCAGAWMLLDVLLEKRPLIKESIADMTPEELAAAMYHSGYYGGIHDPRFPGGIEANIKDYSIALYRVLPAISDGLSDWTPIGAPVIQLDQDLPQTD